MTTELCVEVHIEETKVSTIGTICKVHPLLDIQMFDTRQWVYDVLGIDPDILVGMDELDKSDVERLLAICKKVRNGSVRNLNGFFELLDYTPDDLIARDQDHADELFDMVCQTANEILDKVNEDLIEEARYITAEIY